VNEQVGLFVTEVDRHRELAYHGFARL
jgi:hypothetical protein